MMMENIIQGLLKKGHEVTTIANHKLKAKHNNCSEILINPIYEDPLYCKLLLN